MFGLIFTIGKKLFDLHEAGVDSAILDGLHHGLRAFHNKVDGHHKAHGLHLRQTDEGITPENPAITQAGGRTPPLTEKAK